MDFANMDITGRIAGQATITERDNLLIASFRLDYYQKNTGNVQLQIVVNSQALIEKVVKQYISVKQNTGKRIAVIGQPFLGTADDGKSVLLSVIAYRFCFIDKLLSEMEAFEQARYAVDLSND